MPPEYRCSISDSALECVGTRVWVAIVGSFCGPEATEDGIVRFNVLSSLDRISPRVGQFQTGPDDSAGFSVFCHLLHLSAEVVRNPSLASVRRPSFWCALPNRVFQVQPSPPLDEQTNGCFMAR
jgi:hypothetical protein